jgi:uncharacterized protein (TIGR03437 family)
VLPNPGSIMLSNRFSGLLLSLFCFTSAVSAQPVALNTAPSRVIGQDSLAITSVSPNLVEGREFYQPQSVALDRSSSTPGIYVADTLNNRVLGFRNATSFANGQKADVVLGQPDFVTTLAKGPGTSQVSGLDTPVAVAVDPIGNVYVLDGVNNRILRYPMPFTHSAQTPDLVIGQPTFDTRTPNFNGPSASSVSFTPGNQTFITSLAFDASGNLWVADVANYRVLRFPASQLGAGATNGPSADLVLGQPNFTTITPPPSTDPRLLTSLNLPTSLAFDPTGRLFVLESVNGVRGRVLVFAPPFATGKTATRVLGYDTATPAPPTIGKTQFSASPTGVFTYGAGNLGVVDTQNNRILLFNPVDQWTSDPYTQPAIAVLGQPDFNSGLPNNGFRDATATRLSLPAAAVASGSELFIADSDNHRVVVLPATGNTFGPATRVLGQLGLQFNAPNLVEGRELDFSTLTQNGLAGDAALAIDAHSNPPHLYIADPYNNRVLAFASAYSAKNGAKADFALGQPDLLHTSINYPNNNAGAPIAGGLYQPSALVVDGNGNLYVADRGNGRVLRYPSPFDHVDAPQIPDLVLGESSFTSLDLSTTASTLAAPNGLALASDGSLLVSDILQNRVLEFAGPNFTNGMSAKRVFGQPGFTSSAAGSADNRLSNPYQIATDNSDRLYVADAGNQRLLIFDAVTRAGVDPHSLTALTNVSAPRGVFVNKTTGEIWVTDAGSNAVLRYPAFDALSAAGNLPDEKIGAYSPRAVTVDPLGDLYVADLANRVAIYFRAVALTNGANFLSTAYGPGTFLSIFGGTGQFSPTATSFSTVPVPTTLADTQVLVNGVAAPVYYVQGNQINFLLPMSTPTTGTAEIQVVRASSGQVLGASTISLISASPGLFTNSGSGSGQVAALNQDNSLNGPNNPAAVGSVIQMFGTGQGLVPGAPPDGTPPTTALPTPTKPTVVMNVSQVSPDNIQYSGLAPGLVGLWQVNVVIPASAVPPGQSSASVNVVLTMNNVPSGGATLGRATTIWVKK